MQVSLEPFTVVVSVDLASGGLRLVGGEALSETVVARLAGVGLLGVIGMEATQQRGPAEDEP